MGGMDNPGVVYKAFYGNPSGTTATWVYNNTNNVKGGMMIDTNQNIYYGDNGPGFGVKCLSPSGSLLWNYTLTAAVVSTPALGSDGTIYISCMDAGLYAFNSSGARLRSFHASVGFAASPILGVDGTLYIGTYLATSPH